MPSNRIADGPRIRAAHRASDGELKTLLMTLVYQGWRIKETLATLREKVDFRSHRIERFVAKSKKWRWAEVDAEVCRSWKILPDREDGRLFSYVNRWEVYRAIDALGLPFQYRPHMSRRGFATALNREGVDTVDIARSGQWESTRSVEVYIAPDSKRVRETLSKLRGKTRGKRRKVG